MALPIDIEDILSDDIEEGEILEDDNIYEDVSSHEEFSCEEAEPVAQGVVSVDIVKGEDDSVPKNHRKKDHKCKEDSVCRKERKGKHCFARIRKEKAFHKIKSSDTVDNFYPDYIPKRNETARASSPPGRLRMDYVKPCRHEYKDYHEKENRNSNKKYWNSNEDLSRSRYKYAVEKPIDRGRQGKVYRPKHSSYSSLSTYRKLSDTKFDSSKTSLLKRLVGSGISGVKTLKDDPPVTGNQSEESSVAPSVEPGKHLEIESNPQIIDSNQECIDVTVFKTVETVLPDDNLESAKDSTAEGQKVETLSAEPPETKKKGIGLVWKRSIKDDRDELHLRVEALKSAWIKKFSDRKKRGLLNHKKSSAADDSLADFVLGSSSEEDEKDASPSTTKLTPMDVSGDILKTEDMDLATNDGSHQKPILEQCCKVDMADNKSAEFDGLSPIISPPDSEVPTSEIGRTKDTPEMPIDPAVRETDTEIKSDLNKSFDSAKSNEPLKPHKSSLNESVSKSVKNRRRRARRKAKREAKRKSIASSNELDEERILRENALMTLKVKSKTVVSSLPNEINGEITILDSKQDSSVVQMVSLKGAALLPADNKLSEKGPKIVCEFEGNGAISSDNLDDDIDEDILRAQLLSSLTKQVTETLIKVDSQPKIQNLNIPINVPIKQDKKRVKISMGRVWENAAAAEKKIQSIEIKSKKKVQYPNMNKVKENRILSQVGVPQVRVSPIPQVPKLIISVNDSDSSSDMEFSNDEPERRIGEDPISKSLAAELEANIDRLLQEAKQKTQFGKVSENLEFVMPETNCLEEITEENKNVKGNVKINQPALNPPVPTNATPQALKHLPAWQQEEYRRLKQKIAEKERVLEEVSRAKVVELEEQGKMRNVSVLEDSGHRRAKAGDRESPIFPPCDAPADLTSSLQTHNEILQSSKENIDPPKLEANLPSDENSNPDKKTFNIASCSVIEDINVMNDIVSEFDKNNSEYIELKKKLNRLKRLVKLTETKMSLKEKKLCEMKDGIQKKDRQISSRIDSLAISHKPASEKNKPASRDMELIKLKYKEVSLRAQFLFHDFSMEGGKSEVFPRTEGQDSGGVKRPATKHSDFPPNKKSTFGLPLSEKGKDPPEPPSKRSFSVKERERGDWDPNTPVCHYDLTGICKDQECKYQHFKTV